MTHNPSIDALAFGPHPDDVEIGCGATLAKLAADGYRTAIADLTEGELGTRGSVAERRSEARQAGEILGVVLRENLHLPDGAIRNDIASRRPLIALLRRLRPVLVFAPYPQDRHPDHIHGGELIREACFFSGVKNAEPDLGEAFRPGCILYYMLSTDVDPVILSDVSGHFETKMQAIRAYGSQFYNPGYSGEETYISSKGYFEALETRARYFGWKAGVEHAEAFRMEGYPVVRDVMTLPGTGLR